MRCKTCDYPLWNLSARLCPECGTPFKPSDYEFTLNAVRFCCPHCNQAYYGTGPRGHLVPRSFACVTCARPVDMDEMVLLPAEGVSDEQTESIRQPWLERGTRRKPIPAWFATIGHALTRPGQLLQATPPTSGLGQATLFLLSTLGAIALASGVMFGATMGCMGAMMVGAGGGRPTPGAFVGWQSVGIALGVAAFALVAWLVMTGLVCVVAHGLLRLTGGCAHGLGRTWQALCYSSGANVVSLVPCLGGYIGWIWWAVSASVALKDAQRVHGGRAALAVLAVPLLACAAVVGLYGYIVYSAVSSAPGAFGASFSGQARMGTLAAAMTAATPQPTHPAQLLADSAVSLSDLYDITDPNWFTRASSDTLGGKPVIQFGTGSGAPTGAAAAKAAIAALPSDAIAYRVGDTVFTNPGIDPTAIPAGHRAADLWLAIESPDPAAPPRPATPIGPSPTATTITVALANGTTRTFNAALLRTELGIQNALRATVGLPPLPDPATVTQSTPALTPDGKPPTMTLP
jgi:hypothetical protein